MLANSSTSVPRFSGFCIDLLDILSKKLQFNYSLHLVADGQYGIKGLDGNWTGMVGEIMNCNADLAAAPLTITSSRAHVMSFSSAYMQFGLQMLMLKSSELPTDFWSFLTPLHWSVWLLLVVALLVQSVSFTLVNLFSPYSYRNARRLHDEPLLKKTDCAIDEFSLYNSIWFMAASFTQQGSDKQPLSPSGRIMGIIWYLFSLLMINMYIANLAAVFTNSTAKTSLSDVTALPFQTDFTYGTVTGSQPHMFFNMTTIPAYQRVWNGMRSNSGNSMVSSSATGVEKARNSHYAFIWESPALLYVAQRQPCTLAVYGNPFDLKSYGFGLPLNSAWASELSQVILKLREDGTIGRLEHKWWHEQSECPLASVSETSTTGETVKLAQVSGILFILLGGTMVGFLTLAWEMVKHAREIAGKEKISVRIALLRWLHDCCPKFQAPFRQGNRTRSVRNTWSKLTIRVLKHAKVEPIPEDGRRPKNSSSIVIRNELLSTPKRLA